MNIQPTDRLRLFGAMLHLQTDTLDSPHRRGCRHPRHCLVRNWILERPLFGQYEVLMNQQLNSDLYMSAEILRDCLRNSESWWLEWSR